MKKWIAILCLGISYLQGADFLFHDGDRIVFIGDSLTVQGDYEKYIENFIRTRYPKWKILIRNAGINGYTAQLGYPYIDTDVLIWKPNVAVINWGMNDGRRTDGVKYYQAGIVPYIDKLQKNNIKIVLCSNVPIDIGDEPDKYTNFNQNFNEMANFAMNLAKEKNLIFVDQFHFCHTLWGQNFQHEPAVPVTEYTRNIKKNDRKGDFVHARAPGQLTMSYIILKTLNAPGEVTYAAIDASTGASVVRRCSISNFKKNGDNCSFIRIDEASPAYIDDFGTQAFKLVPFTEELNSMPLVVKNLSAGKYKLNINNFVQGIYTDQDLLKGVNLAQNLASPVYEPGKSVANLINKKKAEIMMLRGLLFYNTPASGSNETYAPWLIISDLALRKQKEFAKFEPKIIELDQKLAAASIPKQLNISLEKIGR